MAIPKYLIIVLLLSSIVGCASKPRVITDYDSTYNFASLKSFSIKEAKQDTKENLLISPFTLGHVQSLVSSELAKRYQLAANDSAADFIVSYHVVMEEKLEANEFDSIYGFGGWGRGYRYPSPFFHNSVLDGGVRVYNQGTLIIDLVDAKTQQPIWRGVSEKRLNKGATPQKQREILTSAVLEVITQFPPVK